MIQKVNVLTITYRDPENGLHAAIFAVPKNHAQQFSADLISVAPHINGGAKVSRVPRDSPRTASSASATPKSHPPPRFSVEPVNSGDVAIPAEFRLAIYENLVQKLEASGIYVASFATAIVAPIECRSRDHQHGSRKI